METSWTIPCVVIVWPDAVVNWRLCERSIERPSFLAMPGLRKLEVAPESTKTQIEKPLILPRSLRV